MRPWASSTKRWRFIKKMLNLQKNSIANIPIRFPIKTHSPFLMKTSVILIAALGKPDKALEFYQKYNQLEQELHQDYPNQVEFKNGLAVSYSKLGRYTYSPGQARQSPGVLSKLSILVDFRNSIRNFPIRSPLKTGSPFLILNLGHTHTALGKLDKALVFYQKYNQLELELYQEYPNQVEFKNGLAISCQFLGNTHTALGQLDKALEFYQKEKELYQNFLIRWNLKTHSPFPIKTWNTHTALGQLDKALEFYEKFNQLEQELYQEYPNQVEFKNNLAVSFVKLGEFYTEYQPDSAKARTCFKEAKVLWEALVEQAPGVLEYQRNLDWVNEYLKKLL
jgi:tetratricopeptide (TPR) repeat protein